MSETIEKRKVLAVDDNKTNLSLLQVYLSQMGIEPLLADNVETALELAIDQQPDIVLLDIMMPDIDGYEGCRRLKADSRTSSIPVIFISAKDQANDKIMGLELGAVDYITKPFDPGELKARIDIVMQMLDLQEQLVLRANTDELTGLPNRRHFFEVLERELLQARMKSNNLSLLMFDFDHFKNINDTYGHLGGDIALKEMASMLQSSLYPLDVPGRYGGEEFTVLMPGTNIEKAMDAGERLRKLVEDTKWHISSEDVKITISMGVATFDPANPVDSYDLIKMADVGLYAAKGRGRNKVVRWDHVSSDKADQEQVGRESDQLKDKVERLATQITEHAVAAVNSFTKTIEVKDSFSANHSKNVRSYVEAIIKEFDFDQKHTEKYLTAALLHDVGMIGVPTEILQKMDDLTDDEIVYVRKHPVNGVEILKPLGVFSNELQIIRSHHENYDGSGYPDGLSAKNIPFGARVLRVADAFDAATSDRWHRDSFSAKDALSQLINGSGTLFDPEVVKAFEKAYEKNSVNWPLYQCEVLTGSAV